MIYTYISEDLTKYANEQLTRVIVPYQEKNGIHPLEGSCFISQESQEGYKYLDDLTMEQGIHFLLTGEIK